MEHLGGDDLRRAFLAAAGRMEEFRDTINALNVFPVPDGDTGTNMLLTLRSAVQGFSDSADPPISEIASTVAEGAFFGARGNSGVILSQIFKGFADALAGRDTSSAADIVRAFGLSVTAAYGSVGTPVEGTMLTVIRRASEAVQERLDLAGPDVSGLFESAFHASLEAVKRTPEQLLVLKEAGVVDSGGLGVAVILGSVAQALAATPDSVDFGGLAHLASRTPGVLAGTTRHSASGRLANQDYLNSTLEKEWGYCTEFIINGDGLDLGHIRSHIQGIGGSTVVVGDDRHVRVHVHTEDPGAVLSYAVSLGAASNIKIENMDDQNSEFASDHRAAPAVDAGPLGVLAVVSSEGLASLFRESGCTAVIDGGQTMNPSVAQLLEAARDCGARETILLPNNKNILAAAEQAAAIEPSLHLVPSKSIPQGVTALLSFNPEVSLEDNLSLMTDALATVASVEVTQAMRETTIDGVSVTKGAYIGLLEGKLITTGESPEATLRFSLDETGLGPEAVVTLYIGADADQQSAESLALSLETGFPGIQVDRIEGGQPHYHYLASVE